MEHKAIRCPASVHVSKTLDLAIRCIFDGTKHTSLRFSATISIQCPYCFFFVSYRRAHNDMTETLVEVNVAHKFFAGHERYKQARHKLGEDMFVSAFADVPLEDNPLRTSRPGISKPGREEPELHYNLR